MKRRARSFLGRSIKPLIVMACLASPSLAHAQRDPTTAEALFDAGRDAAEHGDYATACAKFAESDRLDPAAGTRFNLADCEEHLGHVAAAWTHWKEAIDLLDPSDPRLPVAKQHAAAVSQRVPRLTLRFTGQPPRGLRIRKDGKSEVGPAALDVALPEEPGEHVLEVTAPGHEPAETRVTLAEGESKTLVLELGKALPTEPAPKPTPATPIASPPPPHDESSGGGGRTLGWILGGVGVAGLGVGAVTGVMALGKKSTVEENCYPAHVCNQQGADAASSGRTLGWVSTIGFGAGAVALAAGTYLVLTSKPSAKATTSARLAPYGGPHGGGLELAGSF